MGEVLRMAANVNRLSENIFQNRNFKKKGHTGYYSGTAFSNQHFV